MYAYVCAWPTRRRLLACQIWNSAKRGVSEKDSFRYPRQSVSVFLSAYWICFSAFGSYTRFLRNKNKRLSIMRRSIVGCLVCERAMCACHKSRFHADCVRWRYARGRARGGGEGGCFGGGSIIKPDPRPTPPHSKHNPISNRNRRFAHRNDRPWLQLYRHIH